MAPEVVLGKEYSFASDLWSLGHVCYELCTQRLLFSASCISSLQHKVRARDCHRLSCCFVYARRICSMHFHPDTSATLWLLVSEKRESFGHLPRLSHTSDTASLSHLSPK